MEERGPLGLDSYDRQLQTISTLGKGSFGTVVLAKYKFPVLDLLSVSRSSRLTRGTMMETLADSYHHLSALVAVKTMNRRFSSFSSYKKVREYEFIVAVPSHPSLVQIYDMFVDSVDMTFHIVMETMNQNLFQLMRSRKNSSFSRSTLLSILKQMADGIRHIHRHGYYHRDIKPENILVCPIREYYNMDGGVCDCDECFMEDSYRQSLSNLSKSIPSFRRHDSYVVKLADYGLARHVDNTKPYTAYVSTRWYRSPEILLRSSSYSQPIDIWAFATVAVELAIQVPLFPGSSELDQICKIYEVLGSPYSKGDCEDLGPGPDTEIKIPVYNGTPVGGFWPGSYDLFAKHARALPLYDGIPIEEVLRGGHNDPSFADMILKCLTWDPAVRANIEQVCALPYFRTTHLAKPYKAPLVMCFNGSVDPAHLLPDENSDPASRELPVRTKKKGGSIMAASSSLNIHDETNDGYESEFMKRNQEDELRLEGNFGYLGEEENIIAQDGAEDALDVEGDEEEIEKQFDEVFYKFLIQEHEAEMKDVFATIDSNQSKEVGPEYTWETSSKIAAPSLVGNGANALFESSDSGAAESISGGGQKEAGENENDLESGVFQHTSQLQSQQQQQPRLQNVNTAAIFNLHDGAEYDLSSGLGDVSIDNIKPTIC